MEAKKDLIHPAGKPLNQKVKMGYGMGGIALFLCLSSWGAYSLYYFTDIVGFSASLAGVLVSLGILYDGVSDPVVGMWNDKSTSHKGRRRPYMMKGTIIYFFGCWLLFTDFELPGVLNVIYYVIVLFLFYVGMSAVDIPHAALAAEMTLDYDERSELNTWKAFWADLAGCLSSFILSWALIVSNAFDISVKAGWSVIAFIFAGVGVLSVLVTFKATKGYEVTGEEVEERADDSGFKAYIEVLKNKSFRCVTIAFSLCIGGSTAFLTLGTYYMMYVLNLTEGQVAIANFCLYLPGLVFVFIITKMAVKWSKKWSWMISIGSFTIACIWMVLFIKPGDGAAMTVYILYGVMALGIIAWYQITWAMIPDCVEIDEYKYGVRREGAYYAALTFVQKVVWALSMFVSGTLVLANIGYVPGEVQTPETIAAFRVSIIISALIVGASCVFIAISPMTRKAHAALNEAIRNKKAGLPVDETDIAGLL